MIRPATPDDAAAIAAIHVRAWQAAYKEVFPSECLASGHSLACELKALPPTKLEQAASYVHRLQEATRAERLAALRHSASILSEADGAELERIIEENCERVDPRER